MNHALDTVIAEPARNGFGVKIEADTEREFAAFQELLANLTISAAPTERRALREVPSVCEDEYLARWWISFSGRVNLQRISTFRAYIATWEQTIDVKVDDVSAASVRLRLITDSSLRPHVVDRMVRTCRDRTGAPGHIAIHTP